MISELINYILHFDVHLLAFIQSYGSLVYALLFLIIFIETGVVLAPFLPGDSLLFISGAFASSGSLNLWYLFILLSIAAILGDTVNYWIGHYFGEKVFKRFINPEHMEKTKNFFKNHGKKTIIIARFVPIIRTFAPFVAGIGKMHYSTFLIYNLIGGITWVGIFVFAGYFFGNIPFIQENIHFVAVLIIILSLLPVLKEYISHKRSKKKI